MDEKVHAKTSDTLQKRMRVSMEHGAWSRGQGEEDITGLKYGRLMLSGERMFLSLRYMFPSEN